ncbi:MAG: FliM/FliN family flagellar motor switch protein [Gammaproteobacteria bacterium]|nr:FliM/FliN family flagellar motor switch protein [Gammaproteobacteria bacterium]MDH4313266.1 FliM/FliN family flagellar motor switch protein [Gammaproteobacteria bacterium]MDH5212933.1 FliM/FliN family flagellar motor switch protein [Gammaproteobacteria bacterium]
MTEKVLTDDEKNALLQGVSSGAIEVQSSGGPKYADVKRFAVPRRSQLRTNSFPRLQTVNQHLAERLARHTAANLHCEVKITASDIALRPFSECCAASGSLPAVTMFRAEPLDGQGLIIADMNSIAQLVEGFFGGYSNEPASRPGVSLTAGELSVCRLFSNAILSMVQEVFEPIIELAPEVVSLEVGIELVTDIGETDPVIASNFDIDFDGGKGSFSIVWPVSMVSALVPVFDGQKRDRDAAEDARWNRAIRSRLPEAIISLSGTVGHARLPLGNLAKLKPGDVIDIDSPRLATIYARDVAVMHGQFGVHAGRNAIEAGSWIEAGATHR